jgi:hypothetical protein
MVVSLGALERVDVRMAWSNEAADFTPWLASEPGLKLLNDALGMELEVESTEQSVGPFVADILAKRKDTPDEHWVVIENQLEKTDHRHLGQLLTYAAGLKAATVIWVAAQFTAEHRATIDWLNAMTTDRLRFYGLEIELWRIGASPHAPKINIVSAPNETTNSAANAKENLETGLSALNQLQRRYWEAFRLLLLARKNQLKIPSKAPAQHWLSFSIGRSNFWISAVLNSKDSSIGIEFSFNGPLKQSWFSTLHAQRFEIESAIGTALVWDALEQKKSSRIALYKDATDPKAENQWTTQHLWLAQTLEKFHSVFKPYVLSLPDQKAIEPTDETTAPPDEQ